MLKFHELARRIFDEMNGYAILAALLSFVASAVITFVALVTDFSFEDMRWWYAASGCLALTAMVYLLLFLIHDRVDDVVCCNLENERLKRENVKLRLVK